MRLLLALILVHNMVTSYAQVSSGTSGQKVVGDVVRRVEKVLGSTNKLLERTAWVESKFGRDWNTYRPGYHGGIWQVDAIGFAETKNTVSHPNLLKSYGAIKKEFGIDWPKAKWVDLRNPLYSGIAARLIYRNFPAPIPSDVGGQARYWKKNYNSAKGKGTIYKFAKDVMSYNSDKTTDFSTVGDKMKGQRIFKQRGAQCHTTSCGGKHKVGPNLFGICGRKAGQAPGFNYTQAMKSSGITWTSINLYNFLKNPKRFVPGTKMVFAGMKKDRDLFDIIAFLCS